MDPADAPNDRTPPFAAADPLDAGDEERGRCPVTDDGEGAWTVQGHPEALEVLHDPATFSNRVSSHVSIPNGMDPPEHGRWREIVDRYFAPEAMAAFEPRCRAIAAELIDAAVARGGGDAQADLGEPFAVRAQCAFMGWPDAMRGELVAWQRANHEATRSGDRAATAEVARSFERQVGAILARRRAQGDAAPDDPTTRLLRESIDGRELTDEEIVSIVRTWTVGELGTIAASVGIVVHAVANDPALQARLRDEPDRIPAAADEMLRARGPLVANRRVARRDVELGGRGISAGDRVRIAWPILNRDERVFEAPDEHRLDRDPNAHLVYGAGIHVCPGAPLARLELRVFLTELLLRTASVAPNPSEAPRYAAPPRGGFARVPFVTRGRSPTS